MASDAKIETKVENKDEQMTFWGLRYLTKSSFNPEFKKSIYLLASQSDINLFIESEEDYLKSSGQKIEVRPFKPIMVDASWRMQRNLTLKLQKEYHATSNKLAKLKKSYENSRQVNNT